MINWFKGNFCIDMYRCYDILGLRSDTELFRKALCYSFLIRFHLIRIFGLVAFNEIKGWIIALRKLIKILNLIFFHIHNSSHFTRQKFINTLINFPFRNQIIWHEKLYDHKGKCIKDVMRVFPNFLPPSPPVSEKIKEFFL